MSTTQTFRGIFAIPVTPFTADCDLDIPSLRRCVEFCVQAGAGGVVAPVNASEFFTLTEAERKTVVETAVEQTNGRVPVVAGVSGSSTQVAVEMAHHAGRAGADSVMAMPPFVRHPGPDEIVEFYGAVARAAGVPVWIQDYVAPMGTPMAPALLAKLLREIPGVEYRVLGGCGHVPMFDNAPLVTKTIVDWVDAHGDGSPEARLSDAPAAVA